MLEYAWLIPVIPFVAFLVISMLPKRTLWWEDGGGYATIGAVGALVLSILVIWDVLNGNTLVGDAIPKFEWIVVGDVSVTFGLWVDELTAVMLLVISVVSTLVVIYSGGYMHEEGGRRRRYYAEIMLFISVMYGLVLASNYLEMFIFWELVGLCSYLLIGFWYEKPTAASAAKRAFIVTRVGDIMFMAGIIILLKYTGTLEFSELFDSAATQAAFAGNENMLTLATALIFGGAIGKSAQFPLHEWLPDAMEGPTTVSALIHAATMVKAGVYLVARTYPLLVLTPDSLLFVGIIGGVTALLAATVALAANDIKRVLAYSTISQLGYMILALGAGGFLLIAAHPSDAGYSAAMFHLMNHGFFKALLFLCAGSVIHAIGTNDMRAMGGLRKKMPITSVTMLIGALAIAGIPPLSGFWSKDEVLAAVYNAGSFDWMFFVLWAMGVATAFMTAFYMFRMWFMTFGGEPRSEVHAHESPKLMSVPLMILAGLAVVSGFALFIGEGFKTFIGRSLGGLVAAEEESLSELAVEIFTDPLTYLTLGLVVVGIFVAYRVYYLPGFDRSVFAKGVPGTFQRALLNRWYISKFYDDFAYKLWYGFSLLADAFDRHVIDGLVNGFAFLGANTGRVIRKAQTGDVRRYTSLVVLGIVLLALFVVYIVPWLRSMPPWFPGWF